MNGGASLARLFEERRLWKGQASAEARRSQQPTGVAALDAHLPGAGWPDAALTELLLAGPGQGELQLLWPTLARLSQAAERIALIGPPLSPYPLAWQAAGVALEALVVVRAKGAEVLWAAEQCLRSGCFGAVLCWPERADDRQLRRLQVAAESGRTLAFALRPAGAQENPSPAALRLQLRAPLERVHVLKCRGGQPGVLSLADGA
ncbi:translesion DNA synthesis-associated protein ImuA [Pseudomonas sp. EpS/L25]|uniref:translesion DNA synthesis-associated protein ImuA n=1 Tax=Pseudomonas sp. EpS/L25 TaxID=1749078 RepID=UPI000743849F|nr:translesion DNA synthesis-associated protein ImuA [Pseudomonas sp. EpS/L25]KUM44487.1 CDP-6-deoxy-delta-3,4-glucoseen reductase [Pseudomonas sp. EpS/L25]